jgi:arginyl-tRNA synthetase
MPDLQFIPFGSILGKDRKMLRTRSGDTVQLADVLDEAVERARKIVEEKNPNFSDEEKVGDRRDHWHRLRKICRAEPVPDD